MRLQQFLLCRIDKINIHYRDRIVHVLQPFYKNGNRGDWILTRSILRSPYIDRKSLSINQRRLLSTRTAP